MAKILSPMRSRYLPLLQSRFFSKEIKDSFSKPPLCAEHKKEEKKCHPKPPSCYDNLSACGIQEWPECGEPVAKPHPYLSCCCDSRLTQDPCEKLKVKRIPKEIEPFKSMWEVCGIQQHCTNTYERLDDKHYKESDKRKRIYTQTWQSCEPTVRKRKVCCINEMCQVPPYEKRPKDKCPQTAKEKDNELLKINFHVLKQCLENVPENPNTKHIIKCKKIVMPCCRKIAASLRCHRHRSHSKCLKERCPHPSFSELDHPCGTAQLPVECRCYQFANLCDASRYLIWKKIFRVEPPLPAWPPKERPK